VFAVHQCARFTHCLKQIHEVALKRIARYCKGTRESGMRIAPTNDSKLDQWVDTDFAGLWNAKETQDPVSVQCSSGFVATSGGVPVLCGKTYD
jgi:hypothetical protein